MTDQPIFLKRKPRKEIKLASLDFTADDIPTFGQNESIAAYRKQAWQSYVDTAMPVLTDEPWRRTDISGVNTSGYKKELSGGAPGVLAELPAELQDPFEQAVYSGKLVLSQNSSHLEVDPEVTNKGVIFCDLKTAEVNHSELLLKGLGKVVPASDGKFAALAAATATHGVFLYVPKNVEIENPFHSILFVDETHLSISSHIVLYLEPGAKVTLLHEYASSEANTEGNIFHCGLVEIYAGEGAQLKFVELQSWGANVWNFSHERAQIEKQATVEWIFGALGSGLTKNFSDLTLKGTEAVGKMSGFYIANGTQHLDLDTQQNHFAPYGTTDLLYKGALLGNSRSVWQGMIYVDPTAMKTDGYQANRNLILSPNARADSIPGLEILANDVRCTHGATVGKIEPELVFYLESRGIPKKEAEKLVVEGYFEPIMDRIPFEGVRNRFRQAIHHKMGWDL